MIFTIDPVQYLTAPDRSFEATLKLQNVSRLAFMHATLVRVERVVVVKLLAAKLAGETRLFAALVLEMGGQVTAVLVALLADGARVPRTQHLVHQHYKKFSVKTFILLFEFGMHPVYISMPYCSQSRMVFGRKIFILHKTITSN